MKMIKKLALILCVAVISLMAGTVVFAEYCEFSINGPTKCDIDEVIELTIVLESDQMLKDCDGNFYYDTDYFELVDTSSNEYDEGKIRLRGDFSEDSYSSTWTVELRAIREGDVELSVNETWVQSDEGNTISATVTDYSIEVGEGLSDDSQTTNGENSDNSDISQVSSVSYEASFEFYFAEPATVPSCLQETTAVICGTECRAWKLNDKMSQDVAYSADSSDFYAVYGYIDSSSDACWYLYDTTENCFQRMVLLKNVEVEKAESETGSTSKASFSLTDNILLIIVIIFIVLVLLIVLVNVIFGKLEAKSRQKRIQERQRLSREELNHKRAIEKKIQEKRISETESQNMKRPER